MHSVQRQSVVVERRPQHRKIQLVRDIADDVAIILSKLQPHTRVRRCLIESDYSAVHDAAGHRHECRGETELPFYGSPLRITQISSFLCHARPNETELSHRWRRRARQTW